MAEQHAPRMQAGDRGADCEDSAGEVLIGLPIPTRRGEEQRAQVCPAESAAGHVPYRQPNAAGTAPVRGEAGNPAAAPMPHPEAALGIHGHAIGVAFVRAMRLVATARWHPPAKPRSRSWSRPGRADAGMASIHKR